MADAATPVRDETAAEAETPKPEYVRMDEVEALIERRLKERDEEHARELAEVRATMPQLTVREHGGGPGNDNHQASWSLAEQEAAGRGETLDTWT